MKLEKYESYYLANTDDGEKWSAIGMKVISNLETNKVIVPSTILMNGEQQIIYPIDGFVNADNTQTLVEDLAELISLVDKSEFLERSFVAIDREHIFYDVKENSTKFMIVPIVKEEEQSKQQNDEWIIRCIDTIKVLGGKDVNITPENFNAFLLEKKSLNAMAEGEKSVGVNISELILRYQGEYGHFALFDGVDVFVIGNSEGVEGAITINPSISREHCVITKEPDGFFIADRMSKNGTYVNSRRLDNTDKVLIKNGDTVRLSDMSFTVEIR